MQARRGRRESIRLKRCGVMQRESDVKGYAYRQELLGVGSGLRSKVNCMFEVCCQLSLIHI